MSLPQNSALATGLPTVDYGILVHHLPAAVYWTDEQGLIRMYNEAAAELWGRRPTLGTEAWCGSYRIFRPDGTELLSINAPWPSW